LCDLKRNIEMLINVLYLLGVNQVIIHDLFLQIHRHVLVSYTIWIFRSCPRLPSKQTIQIGS